MTRLSKVRQGIGDAFGPLDQPPPARVLVVSITDFTPLYQELAEKTAEAARVAGLRCAPGCGACCRKPTRDIEASAAEMAPLARALWETGEAEAVLGRAREAGADGWCVLYEPGPDSPYPQGRCRHYDQRPLTCRLFGSAGFRDKVGRIRPTWSPIMRQHNPGVSEQYDRALNDGWSPPVAADWRLRLAEADPRALTDLEPLNNALVRALEREGLAFRYREGRQEA